MLVAMAFKVIDKQEFYVPGLFAIMSHSSESEYSEIFNHMHINLDINPLIINLQLKKEAVKAAREVFPETT